MNFQKQQTTRKVEMPEIVQEIKKSYLFGLVKFHLIVEDRKTVDQGKKYKHMLGLKVLWLKFSFVLRSPGTGIYFINGKEVL